MRLPFAAIPLLFSFALFGQQGSYDPARLIGKPTKFLVDGPESRMIRPAAEPFSGRLVVLVNGGSFSSTEEVVLPHTKISCQISTRIYRIREGMNSGHGVLPRFAVRPDIREMLAARDSAMEMAVRLARRD